MHMIACKEPLPVSAAAICMLPAPQPPTLLHTSIEQSSQHQSIASSCMNSDEQQQQQHQQQNRVLVPLAGDAAVAAAAARHAEIYARLSAP